MRESTTNKAALTVGRCSTEARSITIRAGCSGHARLTASTTRSVQIRRQAITQPMGQRRDLRQAMSLGNWVCSGNIIWGALHDACDNAISWELITLVSNVQR